MMTHCPMQKCLLDDPRFGLSSGLLIVRIYFRSHGHEGDEHIRDGDLDPLGLEDVAVVEQAGGVVSEDALSPFTKPEYDAVTVGTVRNPSKLAAANRPCPARMTPFSSIKIGTRWPKALMLSAICRI